MSATLYELAAEIRVMLDAIGDEPMTDEQVARLESLAGGLDGKVDVYCAIIEEAKLRNVARQAVIDRLRAATAVDDNFIAARKARLKECLELAGMKKIRTALNHVWIQANPPGVDTALEGEAIPEPYRKVRIEADRAKVLEEWKATGVCPEGFTIKRGEHLRMK